MDFKELAKARYSCRKLADRAVPAELMEQIIQAGIDAPTAVNRQPYRIFWMHSDEAKEKIKKVTPHTFGAPEFLVVGYRAEEAWVRGYDGTNFGCVDGSIVATHIMLQLKDLGLDSTWVGSFDAPLLKQLCPQMQEYELIAIFPIGYAAEDAEPSPRHTVRKQKEEVLEQL